MADKTLTVTELKKELDAQTEVLKGAGEAVVEALQAAAKFQGVPMPKDKAVEYVKQLQETAAKAGNEAEIKAAEAARKELKDLAQQAGVILAPGFFGGLIPFYYAIVHLSSSSNKAKWTGVALLVKDIALIGLGVIAYLSGARTAAEAESSGNTVAVMDEAGGEMAEFAEAA
jgi:hypothetical protein